MNIQKRKNNQIEHYFPFVPQQGLRRLYDPHIFFVFKNSSLFLPFVVSNRFLSIAFAMVNKKQNHRTMFRLKNEYILESNKDIWFDDSVLLTQNDYSPRTVKKYSSRTHEGCLFSLLNAFTLSAKLLTASIFILCMATQLPAMQLPMRDFTPRQDIEYVTVAILAKDKAHTLPLYLTCIERQTWPTEKTYLYIRTNNNKDNTAQVLKEWLEKVQDRYAGVYFDDSDVVEQVQRFGHHEWNVERFKVLGKIRQESVDWARAHRSHYFVADCDNFIEPQTIENLVNVNLPIVAPILRTADTVYSNFHAAIDENGYYIECKEYYQLLDRIFRGLVQVPVVHCTYLVRYEVLDKITYDDESYRYEYVIFSDSARKNGIPQYLDTRLMYGYLTCAETLDAFLSEPWVIEHYYDYLSFDQIIYALRMNGPATANS